MFIVWALKRDAGLCIVWKYCCSDWSRHHFPAFCPSGTERHHIWVEKNCIWCRVWQQHRPWQRNRETQSHVHQGLQDAGIHCMHLDCKSCQGNLNNLHRSCGEIRSRNSCFLYLTWYLSLEIQLHSHSWGRSLWTCWWVKCQGSLGILWKYFLTLCTCAMKNLEPVSPLESSDSIVSRCSGLPLGQMWGSAWWTRGLKFIQKRFSHNSFELICLESFYTLFSQNHINPAMDFTQTPPGMLALDNMLYLAKFHQDTYIRVCEAADFYRCQHLSSSS